MKKWLVVLLVLVFGAFFAGTASAAQYDVTVTGGSIWANSGGVSGLPGSFPDTTAAGPKQVQPLDPNYDPFVSGSPIGPLTPVPTGTWNAAGWWEFAVTASTGSDWNDVFGGGNWLFEMTWNGNVGDPNDPTPMDSAYFAAYDTFDNVYGKWYENNPSVWTYLGLYVAPNTGAAQLTGPPIGIFAFVAADPGGNYNWDALYALCSADVLGGTGTITAVPEPATMLLVGIGILGMAGIGRKRFFKK